jgi:hypothetical protein
LSPGHQQDRHDQSRELLKELQAAKRLHWRFILTGDESWFFYFTLHRKIWLPPDADVPEVARRLINTPKGMVTLFWNLTGIHASNVLVGDSFTAEHFVKHVLNPIHLLSIVAIAHKQKKKICAPYGQLAGS